MITTSTPLITSAFSGDAADQFLDRLDRADVGEQSQRFAQAEQRLLGTLLRVGLVPFRSADGAEQNRVAVLRVLEHVIGQRSAGGVERVAADHALLELEIDRRTARDDLENLQSFADDLGADAVTFEN